MRIADREPTGVLTVPSTEITDSESANLGFRHSMFELVDDDDDATVLGTMASTDIAGGDLLVMRYGEHRALVRGRDLYAAWVRQVDPEGAKKLPESVRYAGS